MQARAIFGVLSLTIALVGYLPYIHDIFTQKTKPHAFSWLIWALLAGIAFGVQVTQNGGPGAWLMGFTAGMTFYIFLLSIKYGEKNIAVIDKLCLGAACVALILWLLVGIPLASILLISFVDAVGGFLPTFRKSFYKPQEETEILYILYAISLGFSLVALTSFTLLNALYPAIFVAVNLAMALFLRLRKRALLPVK